MAYLLHMLQQNGYKLNEFLQWVSKGFLGKVIRAQEWIMLGIGLALHFYLHQLLSNLASSIILLVFSVVWFFNEDFYSRKKVKKPLVSTARMKRLYISSGLITLGVLVYMITPYIVTAQLYQQFWGLHIQFMFLNLMLFGIILVAAFINQPIEKQIQEGFKDDARKKLAELPHLKVIAITGSYGKTSVKFMIQALLKSRYNVCFTPGSYNTPMGICKVINNDLNARHQILILEMGARYEGNIEELTQIARPNLSVVTNVGFAHLETFGTQDTIAYTKAAIVRALKEGEVAILNADDPRVSKMGEEQPIDRLLCGFDDGELRATNISYSVEGCSFTIEHKDFKQIITIPLLGAHNVSNFLLAFGVGLKFGLRPETMAEAAQKLVPTEHRLELKTAGDYYIIDDAFNSNPIGAKNAVDILAQFNTGKRYIITPGMIELGEKEEEENFLFGEHIGKSNLDGVLLVGLEKTKPIYEGVLKSGYDSSKVKVFDSLYKANDYLKEVIGKGDVVLYENDLPDSYNE